MGFLERATKRGYKKGHYKGLRHCRSSVYRVLSGCYTDYFWALNRSLNHSNRYWCPKHNIALIAMKNPKE